MRFGRDRESPEDRLRERILDGLALERILAARSERLVALHQHDARADALELDEAAAAAAGAAIETDVVRAEAGRQAGRRTGSRYRTARSRGTCRRFAHPSTAGSSRRASSCPTCGRRWTAGRRGAVLLLRGLPGVERPDPRAAEYRSSKSRLFQHDHSWRVVILTCAAEVRVSSFGVSRIWPRLRPPPPLRCGPARLFASLLARSRSSPPSSRPRGLRFAAVFFAASSRCRLGAAFAFDVDAGVSDRLGGLAAARCLRTSPSCVRARQSSAAASDPSAPAARCAANRSSRCFAQLARGIVLRQAARAACTSRDSLCSVCSYAEP